MKKCEESSGGINRRQFLGETSCATVAGSAALNSLLNFNLIGRLAADEVPEGDDYRALICVFLAGGNDSFNMLVPRGKDRYLEYSDIRKNLALPREDLLPFSYTAPGQKELGLHPELHKVRDAYDAGELAFVTNVGTLQQPVTKGKYELSPQLLPDGLYSHSDQQQQWHTSLPERSATSGWFGRLSDLIGDLNGGQNFASSISINGTNLLQTAAGSLPYVVDPSGPRGLSQWNDPAWGYGRSAVISQLDLEYDNLIQKTFIQRKKLAIELNEFFGSVLNSSPSGERSIGESKLGDQLEMVLKIINSREALGVRRQTFFVSLGGWDLHSSLLSPHKALLSQLDDALGDFQIALKANGLSDQVTTFTASDFGRSLTSNGQGSDHGWGGHQMIMGGAVNGGRIYGEYPDLYEDNPLDVGRGRLIPTTSVDEYFAELACWFGVSRQQLPLVFPNLNRFYDLARPEQPLGFMNLG